MLRILCAVRRWMRSCRKPAARCLCAPDGAPYGAFENAAHSLRGAALDAVLSETGYKVFVRALGRRANLYTRGTRAERTG